MAEIIPGSKEWKREIYANQTAILEWLRSRGHEIDDGHVRMTPMKEFKETRPPHLPRTAPKASDLVARLMADVRDTLGDRLTDRDAKELCGRFHTSARAHRHAIERFGKHWKKRFARIEATNAG